MATDSTVKIFNQFYQLDLTVNSNEYDIVNSFFIEYTKNQATAKNFTETLFRISNFTQIPALKLLDEFRGIESMNIGVTMAYYLNSLSNRTVLFGVNNLIPPNQIAQRNIVQSNL